MENTLRAAVALFQGVLHRFAIGGKIGITHSIACVPEAVDDPLPAYRAEAWRFVFVVQIVSACFKGSFCLIIRRCLHKAHAAKYCRKADSKDQQQTEPCFLWFIHQ